MLPAGNNAASSPGAPVHDQDLLTTVVGAARAALPLVLEQPASADCPAVDIGDIEAPRMLVQILVDSGTTRRSLEWTAEVLEVTSKVMTHHRRAVPIEGRQAWGEVNLLFRTCALAFAEAVGRIPGTETRLGVDLLDVTRVACRELGRAVDHGSVALAIASLDTVLVYMPRVGELGTPYASDEVERVATGLRPVEDHRSNDS